MGCTTFNSDVPAWNMGNSTDLKFMNHGCTAFNLDVSAWNVGNATVLLFCLFCNCTAFNYYMTAWNFMEFGECYKVELYVYGMQSLQPNVPDVSVILG